MKIKHMIRKIFLCGCLALFTVSASAQIERKKWSLQECIDYAIENNISIQQQGITVESSEIDLNNAKNNRLPNLSASAGQSYGQGVSPVTGGYETKRTASTSMGISSSVTLYAGSRMTHQVAYNELNLKAAVENLEKAKESLGLQVAAYYLDVLFKKELLRVAREQMALTEKQLQRTEVLVQEGKVPESQRYDMEAQLAQNRVSLTSAQNSLDLSLLDLAQSLNLSDTERFDIREPGTENLTVVHKATSANEIFQIASGIKPQVREAEYRLESGKQSVKIAKSALLPQLSLSAGYNSGYSYPFDGGADPFFDQIRDNRRLSVSLGLSIPIFSRFQNRNSIKSARLNVQSRELELENVKRALYKEIQQAYQSAVAAEAKFTSTEAAYTASQLSYEHAEKRYDVGKSTVFELSEAQNRLVTSQSEQLQAKYEYLFQAKILDFYRGVPLGIN
jgi:Outer membrane protein